MQTDLFHIVDQRSIKTVTLLITGVERNVPFSESQKTVLCNMVGVLKIGFEQKHYMSAHLSGELNIYSSGACPKYL